jgi:hypothetical protein
MGRGYFLRRKTMDRVKEIFTWYKTTSLIVGFPILAMLLFLGFQKFVFTSSCMIANYRCERAIGADEALTEYMGDLLAANPGTDIVAKRSVK